MPELVRDKRVKFPKGTQKDFLDSVQRVLCVTQIELAGIAGISLRTFTDWKREKNTLPLKTAQSLSRKSNIPLPKGVNILRPHWHTKKAGAVGAQAVLKKYGRLGGDADAWRRKWSKWWEEKGRLLGASPVGRAKTFSKPKRSAELAEFIGIILGDGSISKTQVVITLHSVDDELYARYVRASIKKLFAVEPGTFAHKTARAISIYISRSGLVEWLMGAQGLKVGNKVRQQVEVPVWIKDKLSFSVACVRGLMDTDGCVFHHTYTAKGKKYTYTKLHFTSASLPLVYFVYETFSRLGLHPRLARKDGEIREVRLDSKEDMRRYFKRVGTHNPKFLKRWRE
ncbi:MAG: LAGLIDADG family homing endonuclease [bacterium]|nr:LAGLIDADG family homing endonuclease [bacterium]